MLRISSPPLLGVFRAWRFLTIQCLFAICALPSTFILSGCASVATENSASNPTTAGISVLPAEIDFKSVVVGQKNSQTLQITNTSKRHVNLSALHITGAGFSLVAEKVPLLLAPGKNLRMNIVFAPSRTASENGALTISSPDVKTPLTVPLRGFGEKPAPGLQVSPSTINFGSHSVNSSAFQTVTLTDTGNTSLTVNSITVSGAGFTITGLTPGVSVSPNQKLEFQVWFHPTIAGNSVATLVANVASLFSPVRLTISGSATTSTSIGAPSSTSSHSVALNWNPSSSSVAGYYVYRGGVAGGPYNRIDNSIVNSLSYSDASVQSGSRYYYVVTALGSDGVESPFSNEVAAIVPNP